MQNAIQNRWCDCPVRGEDIALPGEISGCSVWFIMRSVVTFLGISLACTLAISAWAQGSDGPIPRFQDYPVKTFFRGRPVPPVLATPEERRYRTRIQDGVSVGRGVWTGSWKDAKEKAGPNFAGHYTVIRWGCGSECLMMAIVDAETGKVNSPPLSGAGTELFVPMDIMSDREIDFRLDSTLMVLRNACRKDRTECGVYYFNWKDDHFILEQRTLVDLTKSNENH